MNIVYNPNGKRKENKFERNERIATEGCHTCFNCGETGSPKLRDGKLKGIFSCCETYEKGFFITKLMKVQYYTCYTCGAQWKSEPFRYA